MKAFWSTTKPDGTPITDGRLCRVVDPEDGSIPIRVYGRTQDEVFSKIERTMMTAQSTLSEVKRPAGNNGGAQPPANGAGAAPPRNPAILSVDDRMRLTADLSNPEKSAQASYRLAESERARQQQEVKDFVATSEAWQSTHPELKDSLFNKKLITDNARMRAGGLSKVTAEVLEHVYQELTAGGYLVTEEELPASDEPLTPAVQLEGIQDPVPTRPRSAVVSTTGHRSTRLGAPQAPRFSPKYTLADLNRLTTRETAELNKPTHPGHKEFVAACNYWYGGGQAQATA
jgi:hypothetical protein